MFKLPKGCLSLKAIDSLVKIMMVDVSDGAELQLLLTINLNFSHTTGKPLPMCYVHRPSPLTTVFTSQCLSLVFAVI